MFLWHTDADSQSTPLVVTTVFTLLASLAVAMRLWARYLQQVSLAANDYIMIFALFFTGGIYACELLAVLLGGVGLHQETVETVNPESLTTFGILIFVIQLLWPIVQGLVKVSMCCLYMAVFPQQRFRLISIVLISICAMLSLCVVIVTLLVCIPLTAQWDPTVPNATCGNRVALWLWGGILNVVTDVLVIYLPMPMVWSLYISKGQKWTLTSLFGAGLIVTAVSVVRLHYVLMVDFTGDATYTVANAAQWSLIESTLGIFIGCLPVVGPAIRYIVPDTIAQRWSYAPSSNLRSGNRPLSGGRPLSSVHDVQERNRFGLPCATRAPTPHPVLAFEQNKHPVRVESVQVQEDNVLDSMERGNGIMVKVEWEVVSDTRSSWPFSRVESEATNPRSSIEADRASAPGA